MTSNTLRIRFLSFEDVKKQRVSNLILYVKKLVQVPRTSTSCIQVEEKDEDSPVILDPKETFDLSDDDIYCQILFLKSKSDKRIADLIFSRQFLIDQYVNDAQYVPNTSKEISQTATIKQAYTFHYTIQLLQESVTLPPTVASHFMQIHHFNEPVSCVICGEFLWGIFHQGCECSQCSLVTHKKCCQLIPFYCQKSDQCNMPIPNRKEHAFLPHSSPFVKSLLSGDKNYCRHCGSQVFRHALRCSKCNFIIHKHCQSNVPSMCGIRYLLNEKERQSNPKPSPACVPQLPKFVDFQCIGEIGKGGYGTVFCVKHKKSSKFLAIKVVDGSRNDARVQFEVEKEILNHYNNRSPYMTKGYFSFHCGRNLFLGMEFVDGDTLREKMRRLRMNEEEIRFYLAEIISVLRYLHKDQIMYRDLKPEHIIINSAGHIRLVDFGLGCKLKNSEEKCFMFCGTYTYIAPEVANLEKNPTQGGYSYSADYWSLGVIFGQMLADTEDAFVLQPSSENDSRPLQERVKDAVRSLPAHISSEARSCLLGLLEVNPTERLNSQETSSRFICDHPFFSVRPKIDWEQIDEGVVKPLNKRQTICSVVSTDMPFANLSFKRGEHAQEEWMRAGQSTCTSAEEERYRSFDSVNDSTWSELI